LLAEDGVFWLAVLTEARMFPKVQEVMHESIEAGVSPATASGPRFRIVIEDEDSGQEFVGFSGHTRSFVESVVAFIKARGDHDLSAGRLPKKA
jgi:hypothetical protein